MKTMMKAGVLVAALAACASAHADTVTLNVTGKITPEACSIVLANGGNASFGRASVKALHETDPVKLHIAYIPATITCAADSKFAIRFIDAQAASVNTAVAAVAHGSENFPTRLFGLGVDKSNNRIGGYYARFNRDASSEKADGSTVAASTIVSLDGTTYVGNQVLVPDVGRVGWKNGNAAGGGSVDTHKVINAALTLHPGVVGKANLDLADEIQFKGEATMELHYL